MGTFSVEETKMFVTLRRLHRRKLPEDRGGQEPGPRAASPARACTAPGTDATAESHREVSGARRGAGTGRGRPPAARRTALPGARKRSRRGAGREFGRCELMPGDSRPRPGACTLSRPLPAPPSGPASPPGSALPARARARARLAFMEPGRPAARAPALLRAVSRRPNREQVPGFSGRGSEGTSGSSTCSCGRRRGG